MKYLILKRLSELTEENHQLKKQLTVKMPNVLNTFDRGEFVLPEEPMKQITKGVIILVFVTLSYCIWQVFLRGL